MRLGVSELQLLGDILTAQGQPRLPIPTSALTPYAVDAARTCSRRRTPPRPQAAADGGKPLADKRDWDKARRQDIVRRHGSERVDAGEASAPVWMSDAQREELAALGSIDRPGALTRRDTAAVLEVLRSIGVTRGDIRAAASRRDEQAKREALLRLRARVLARGDGVRKRLDAISRNERGPIASLAFRSKAAPDVLLGWIDGCLHDTPERTQKLSTIPDVDLKARFRGVRRVCRFCGTLLPAPPFPYRLFVVNEPLTERLALACGTCCDSKALVRRGSFYVAQEFAPHRPSGNSEGPSADEKAGA